ncbi:MAG: PHP domain-containing protein, partial [Candidatus Pacearchaeota archaeon]
WSDGNNTIKEMADKAEELDYKYLAITDHGSQNGGIYNALDEKRIKKQWKEIDKVNKKSKVKLLKGSEIDILRDGSLSLPDEILEKLDVVIASVHSGFKMSEKEMTERILKSMENKNVNIIGHPTGRVLRKREGYKVDLDRIIEKASEKGIALEANASPRIDLNDTKIKKAKEKGAKISIGTDSHDKGNAEYLDVGVGQARRAWCENGDILNAWNLTKLRKFLKRTN